MMIDWWPAIGETSIGLGTGLGLIWAAVSTILRRRRFLRAGMLPVGQMRWFLLNLVGMGSYVALACALGLASLHDLIPHGLFWLLLGLSAAAFASALMVPGTVTRHPGQLPGESREPPADPPQVPVRRSA